MAFESKEGSAPASSLCGCGGQQPPGDRCWVLRQELEKGPLKELRASGGLQGRLRWEPREVGSGERLVEGEASSHSDSG